MQSINKKESVRVVVMGVTGCGKSTCATAIANAIKGRFCDGDSLHSPDCVEKMRRGIPLNDTDRWPWFSRIAAFLNADSSSAVVACSALKKTYRDFLRREVPDVRFVFLDASCKTVAARVSQRQGHYMPASLVDSQFAALEPPLNEPRVTIVSADAPVAEIVSSVLVSIGANTGEDESGTSNT